MKNLNNLTVLVTRPKPQGTELCELIRKAGGEAIYFPTIAIHPPENHLDLIQQITTINTFDYLIFISPQAVLQTIDMIQTKWPALPTHLKIAAIGEGTAKILKERGLPVDFFPPEEWNSQGLLQLLADSKNISGKKIALIKGEGGRELLKEELTARGAKVTEIIAYRRVLPIMNVIPYTDLFHANKIHVIICLSGESVKNLKILVGENSWRDLKNIPLLVNSERIESLAKESGFKKVLLAKNASHRAIIDTLLQEKEHLCQTEQKNN
jgi:uroporphyrinogen-III synthase